MWGPKDEHVATFKAGSFGQGELSYTRRVSDKVGLATELMYCHNQMCTFGLGYEFRLRQVRQPPHTCACVHVCMCMCMCMCMMHDADWPPSIATSPRPWPA